MICHYTSVFTKLEQFSIKLLYKEQMFVIIILGTFNSWVLPLSFRLEVMHMSKKDFLVFSLIIIILLLIALLFVILN